MVNVAFVSLGCAKNQVDLEHLAGSLTNGVYNFVNDPAECDVVIINTCGFLKDAVSEAIETILSVKQEISSSAKLVVFGCMSERYMDEIARELPEVDFFAGVGDKAMQSVLDYISSSFETPCSNLSGKRYLFTPPYYAYLKIAEGCNNRCSYCAIPSIRGVHRSVSPADILSAAQTLAFDGARELVVVSQDITKYGNDLVSGYNLALILDELASKHKDIYFRLMYLNPDGVTQELINTVKKHENIIRYFDIPVQHGSDAILKSMNRHYGVSQIKEVFATIRKELPDAFIRTTLIVGFPGETDEDFNQSVLFLEEFKPDYAGFFPFSPEEGTRAYGLAGRVDDKIVKKRLKILQSIQKKNTLEKLRSIKNDEIVCFVEQKNEDFEFILEGRALFQAPEVDGQLFVIDGVAASGYGPYKARIKKIAYPDLYVELIGEL